MSLLAAWLHANNDLIVVSRELREPIDTIASYAELLVVMRDESLPPEQQQDYHNAILASSRQLQALLKDVVDVSQNRLHNNVEVEVFDVAQLLEQIAESMREQAAHRFVSIIVSVIEDVELRGDLFRLRRVSLRLLASAISASVSGGSVLMRMQRDVRGGLVIIFRGPEKWRPELSLARKLISAIGGKIIFDEGVTLEPEVRLSFPLKQLHWPSLRPNQATDS